MISNSINKNIGYYSYILKKLNDPNLKKEINKLNKKIKKDDVRKPYRLMLDVYNNKLYIKYTSFYEDTELIEYSYSILIIKAVPSFLNKTNEFQNNQLIYNDVIKSLNEAPNNYLEQLSTVSYSNLLEDDFGEIYAIKLAMLLAIGKMSKIRNEDYLFIISDNFTFEFEVSKLIFRYIHRIPKEYREIIFDKLVLDCLNLNDKYELTFFIQKIYSLGFNHKMKSSYLNILDIDNILYLISKGVKFHNYSITIMNQDVTSFELFKLKLSFNNVLIKK